MGGALGKQNYIPTIDKFTVRWKGWAADTFLWFNGLSSTGQAPRAMKPPNRYAFCLQYGHLCMPSDLNRRAGIAKVSVLLRSKMTICSQYSLTYGSLHLHEIRFLRCLELPLYPGRRAMEDWVGAFRCLINSLLECPPPRGKLSGMVSQVIL